MSEDYEVLRKKYIWKEVATVKALHQELASLYRTKSTDRKRIKMLWDAIEEREAILFLDGVSLEGI